MKREIKFKVKLKREHSFREAYAINFLNKTAMVLIGGQYEWDEYKKIVQFTGLPDKNGKEIYEGDIILTEGKLKAPMDFENGCFGLRIKRRNGDEWFMPLNPRALKNKEVIGNVFENPELLNS